MSISVDVWSDIVCPWCYIGKRRFEAALAAFPQRDEVRVRWRGFELDPDAPTASAEPVAQRLQRDRGLTDAQVGEMFDRVTALAAEEGLTYRLAEAHLVNSFHLHRLHQLATARGVGDAVLEGLMHAQHCAAADLSDRTTLLGVATGAGLDEADATALLDGTDYADEVRADEAMARRLGVTGVPAFVFADRYLVSGAQPVELFTAALRRAWQDAA